MTSGRALPRARFAAQGPHPAARSRDTAARPRAIERRRRQQHFARRRRDLLEDSVLAVALAIMILSVTAGLGVVALLEIPIGAVLIGSVVAERVIRHRRAGAARSGPTRTRRS